jgi:hypothetical protein
LVISAKADPTLESNENLGVLVARERPKDSHDLTRKEHVGRVDPCAQDDEQEKVERAHLERLQHIQGRVEQILHVKPTDVQHKSVICNGRNNAIHSLSRIDVSIT